MNYFHTSKGERVSKAEIDRRVRKAKIEKLDMQRDLYGYNFCSLCFRNDDLPLDCAHFESIDSCQKNGYAEKAWDINNIEIVGRKCHNKHDNLDIRNPKIKSNENN